MDNELGPATGDFRVWLDLAIARGFKVVYLGKVLTESECYVLDSPIDYCEVYSAKDIQVFFEQLDRKGGVMVAARLSPGEYVLPSRARELLNGQ